MIDAEALIEHIEYWQELVRLASRQHQSLPPSLVASLHTGDHTEELARMVGPLEMLPSSCRHEVESVLELVLVVLRRWDEVSPPGAVPASQGLRVVGGEDG